MKKVFVLGCVLTVLSGASMILSQHQSISADEAQEVQHVSDYDSFDRAIRRAPKGTPVTIALDADLTVELMEVYVREGKDITIDGCYHVINGIKDTGIIENSGNLHLKNITLTGITGKAGTALCNYSEGVATLDNVWITNNTAYIAAAILNTGDLTLANGSAVCFNTGTWDSVIRNMGRLCLNGAKIFNNTSNYRGGGIYSQEGELEIHNSCIKNNLAENGGGIYSNGDKKFIIDSSFVQWNHASNDGGGIYATSAPEISGYTCIWANVAGRNGDEIYPK